MRRAALAVLVVVCAAGLAAAGKTGTVRLKEEGITLQLVTEGAGKLDITSKPMTLKAGNYDVRALRLLKPDDRGRVWELRFQGDLATSTLNNVSLDEGQDKIITEMEPINFHCVTWQWPADVKKVKTVLMRLVVEGRHSETYYPGAFLKGEKPPLPEYKVLDENGKTIGSGRVPENDAAAKPPSGSESGKMAKNFAAAATYQWNWVVPPGFTGKFTVELKPVMGPFDWKLLGGKGEVK